MPSQPVERGPGDPRPPTPRRAPSPAPTPISSIGGYASSQPNLRPLPQGCLRNCPSARRPQAGPPTLFQIEGEAKVSRRSMTRPTMLFGVEAPAVRPTPSRPPGSQSWVLTSWMAGAGEPGRGPDLGEGGRRRGAYRPVADLGAGEQAIGFGNVEGRDPIGADP